MCCELDSTDIAVRLAKASREFRAADEKATAAEQAAVELRAKATALKTKYDELNAVATYIRGYSAKWALAEQKAMRDFATSRAR